LAIPFASTLPEQSNTSFYPSNLRSPPTSIIAIIF
jgi:hypothetical protein